MYSEVYRGTGSGVVGSVVGLIDHAAWFWFLVQAIKAGLYAVTLLLDDDDKSKMDPCLVILSTYPLFIQN